MSEQTPATSSANTPFVGTLPVFSEGYEWRQVVCRVNEDNARFHRVLSPRDPRGSLHRIAPLAEPSLHRRLGRVRLTPDAIARFAGRYGNLSHGHVRDLSPGNLGEDSPTFEEWRTAIAGLSGAIQLWDALRSREIGKVSRLVKPLTARGVVSVLVFTDAGLEFAASARAAAESAEDDGDHSFDPAVNSGRNWIGDVFDHSEREVRLCILAMRPARSYGSWHGTVIEPHCNPDSRRPCPRPSKLGSLILNSGPFAPAEEVQFETPLDRARLVRELLDDLVTGALKGHTELRVSNVAPNGFAVVPDCLLAAAYVHLAFEIAGRTRRLLECAYGGCGRAFEPADSRQRYCEDRCRKSAFHHRRER